MVCLKKFVTIPSSLLTSSSLTCLFKHVALKLLCGEVVLLYHDCFYYFILPAVRQLEPNWLPLHEECGYILSALFTQTDGMHRSLA